MKSKRAFIALCLIVALVGCSNESNSSEPILSDIVGLSLDRPMLDEIPEASLWMTQDISSSVGREPTFDATQIDSDYWTIVAACADAEALKDISVIEIAVLPTELITAGIREQVAEREFDDAVACDTEPPRPFRG